MIGRLSVTGIGPGDGYAPFAGQRRRFMCKEAAVNSTCHWDGYSQGQRFVPHYVYCGVCGTGYSVSIVGPLCPCCQVPFESVQGVMENVD